MFLVLDRMGFLTTRLCRSHQYRPFCLMQTESYHAGLVPMAAVAMALRETAVAAT